MEQKAKRIGKFNVIDIIAVVLILAVVAFAGYKLMNRGGGETQVEKVKVTYQVVSGEEVEDMEQLYADILDNKVTVTYRSKLWEIIKNRCGFEHD